MPPAATQKQGRSGPLSSERPTPQNQQKRRGRPRKADDGEDELTKKRRARNREAQLVFRVRKQAVQQSQEQQIRRLEETIQRISSAFLGLADTMLQSDTAIADPSLMEELGRTTEDIADLARSLDDGQESETSPAAEVPTVDEAATATTVTGAPPSVDPPSAGPPMGVLVTHAPNLNTNVFGNGWFGQVASNFPHLAECTVAPLPSVSDFPLAVKIIIATIQIGYHALFETIQLPGDSSRMIVNRVFNYSLRYHSAEEIMFNLRWFLGPGQQETHRLGNISFVTGPFAHIYREALKSHRRVGEFVPAIDDDAFREVAPVREAVSESVVVTDEDAYVNANAVERYLWEKGIWFVGNDDIIEVPASVVESMPAFGAAAPAGARQGGRSRPPKPWDFFNFNSIFIGDRPPSPGALSVRVSQTKLLRSLVGTAVCLASGPGYERRLIDEAIKAAVVE
ncbi:hypothetical protein B0T18DRAFT_386986 [Schizothecium vesticola]|uniref:BZIP domain-containing protein n=1 Tax=Schizothecium vesticola TaxID=314040 RepID=A0AA40F3U9_9PEZI|nr:hypothetical protein B0T18DRAFT_386986 [Schizothecium vesticola]